MAAVYVALDAFAVFAAVNEVTSPAVFAALDSFTVLVCAICVWTLALLLFSTSTRVEACNGGDDVDDKASACCSD